jgi:hypothetical protein
MNEQVETWRDETLAIGLYTGVAETTPPLPPIRLTRFEYTIRRESSLLDKVVARFGESLKQELPPEHLALLERGEEQSPEDIALAERMRDVQREALMH